MYNRHFSIRHELYLKLRMQGLELMPCDIGRRLDVGWGEVQHGDVGKRVWLREYGLTMENNEQRNKRKGMK